MITRGKLLAARLLMREVFTPPLHLKRLTVSIPEMPPGLDGFCIGQLSDLHVGEDAWMPLRVQEAARELRAAEPDVLVNTGDFLQGDPSLRRVEAIVRQFYRPEHQGISGPTNLAILGNHDYYAGLGPLRGLRRSLERVGISLLDNEVVQVQRDGDAVTFAGLNIEEPGFWRALREVGAAAPPRIVLVHAPDTGLHFPPNVADLVLCGHTHGGQIAIPGLTPWIVHRFSGSRISDSILTIAGNRVVVSAGLGCTGIPLRFRAGPEVAIIRLVR